MEKEKDKNVNFKTWLSKVKNLKKNQIFMVLLAGILLVIIALPTKQGEETRSKNQTEQAPVEKVSNEKTDTDVLEEKLVSALGKVKGVGKVEVMLTRKSSGQKIVEKDKPVSDKTTDEQDNQGGNRVTRESTQGEETVYAQDGSGAQTPYVIEELEPEIQGVVVVAEGGDNPVVVQNITEAVMALFGVEVHKIKVMKMS
ncbi:stage III sporulation protein AG [Murimonas intestini]|uniref:Stage III sporulation protein AG n=1 Tax=Murimonas intestini TaxID=1337051 RepID=A0AB73T794_9FIRM|nr:stage III sporulation protein AG [Murimonas intestini]MCR1841267.1 stage III sporulation protein AG [Murimonas intestini]MCR1866185.1 stage III sporulation protein AG [Murimonas intestini]MCR1882698.1 stage III sporulation protein AG [Murimonas intestini]